jgi:hypothetical protein
MSKEIRESKSKTFQKGDDYGDAVEWFLHQIETTDYQPEGTEWSGGEPGPHDPVCELTHKYIVTVTKIELPEPEVEPGRDMSGPPYAKVDF